MNSRLVLWICAAALAGSFALQAADVTGRWVAQVPGRGGETREETFNFKQEGAQLTDSASGLEEDLAIKDGKVEGENISFSVTYPFGGGMKMLFKGTVSADEIKMTGEREGGSRDPSEFTAKRAEYQHSSVHRTGGALATRRRRAPRMRRAWHNGPPAMVGSAWSTCQMTRSVVHDCRP